ncbi:MAG: hypothetical protein V2B15_11790 [Bacteroidota bacterium]
MPLFIHQCSKGYLEELVEFPNTAFLEALVDQGVDQNGDGRISFGEAEACISILLGPSGITDLSGIEAFTNLECLCITLNPLTSLDVSEIPRLHHLQCESCELSTLDISRNNNLTELHVGRNRLTTLDLSKNTSLTRMSCDNNLLSRLDLSNNHGLVFMISCGNLLTELDISNNTQLVKIGFDNMPMLHEVCVWTLPFPPPGVEVLMEYSPNVHFTTDCSIEKKAKGISDRNRPGP